MLPLEKSLRNRLERAIKESRDVAEDAARAALEQLGVGEASPFPHLRDQDRDLRRKLRVHGRQLGDPRNAKTEVQEIDRLIEEVAYEHWHRMLFARFLAENNLLIYVEEASSLLKSDSSLFKVEAASSRLKDADAETPSTHSKEIGYFHPSDAIANLSGNLPHWRQDGVTYFVTFRTADSVPQEKLRQWQIEKEAWLRQHPEPHDAPTRKEYNEKFPKRIQQWLDQGYGECLLRKPVLKNIVENALRNFDGQRYDLDEFVVMPNHVHVLVTPKANHRLSDILHSWKSFTANAINIAAGLSGTFWQKESFDHIVRSPGHWSLPPQMQDTILEKKNFV